MVRVLNLSFCIFTPSEAFLLRIYYWASGYATIEFNDAPPDFFMTEPFGTKSEKVSVVTTFVRKTVVSFTVIRIAALSELAMLSTTTIASNGTLYPVVSSNAPVTAPVIEDKDSAVARMP